MGFPPLEKLHFSNYILYYKIVNQAIKFIDEKMTQDLLIDMYYAAPELWYGIGMLFIAVLAAFFYFWYNFLQMKQRNYFLNRDRERYAETLYASKDGYFAFIYPDQKIDDPRKNVIERCSRRLAVILNLNDGTNTSFEDIYSLYNDILNEYEFIGDTLL